MLTGRLLIRSNNKSNNIPSMLTGCSLIRRYNLPSMLTGCKKRYNGSRDHRAGGCHPRTGHNGSQDEKAHTPYPRSSKMGVKTLEKAAHHPSRGTMGVKTLEKADTPSKKAYKGSQDAWEGGHTNQEGVQRESKLSGRRTHHPRRDTKKPRPSSRRTHHPRRGTTGAKTLAKADTPSRRGAMAVKILGKATHHPKRGTKGVKTPGKADTPSKKDPRESGHTIQERVQKVKTLGKVDISRESQDPWEGGQTCKKGGTKGVKILEKADAPSLLFRTEDCNEQFFAFSHV